MDSELHVTRRRFWLLSVGFALMLALNAFILWGVAAFFPITDAWAAASGAFSAWCIPVNFAVFLLFALGRYLRPRVFGARPFSAGALFIVAAFLILVLAKLVYRPSVILLSASGLCAGVGSALLMFCWEQVLADTPDDNRRGILLSASALTIVPYLILIAIPHPWLLYALTFILVPACLLTVRAALSSSAPATASVAGDSTPGVTASRAGVPVADYRLVLSDLWVPMVCAIAFGLISPMVSIVGLRGTLSPSLSIIIVEVGNLLAVLILSVIWKILRYDPSITRFCLVTLPLLAIALLLFPFLGSFYAYFLLLLGATCYTLFSMLMMLACIQESEQTATELAVVYGLFAGILYASRFVGTTLANTFTRSGYSDDILVLATAFFLAYLISLVAFLAYRAVSRTKATPQVGKGDATEPAPLPTDDDVDRLLGARCRTLATAYNLSAREIEVMELVAKGNTVSATAQRLYVSENTVRTHLKRLYRALDIHSRQELLDLIGRTPVSPDDKPR